MAVVANRWWSRSTPRPDICECALLTDARLVGEPDLQRLAGGAGWQRFGYQAGKFFAVYPFPSADSAWQILRKLSDGEGTAMARNSVQFQKGLSEAEFEERYGTEERCRAVVMGSRWPNGFECPACGGRAYSEVTTRRLFRCSACRHQTSLTAGTIVAATHLPLRLWFRAMYHLTQSKQGISSVELGRRLGVRQFTAWKMKHKLAPVMMERDAGKRLSGRVEIDDAYLGGEHRRQAWPRRPWQGAVLGRCRDHARGQAGAPEAAAGCQLLQPCGLGVREAEP